MTLTLRLMTYFSEGKRFLMDLNKFFSSHTKSSTHILSIKKLLLQLERLQPANQPDVLVAPWPPLPCRPGSRWTACSGWGFALSGAAG